ncbi:hypothetical protein JCM19237_1880 [Photobacterium aphoticum]|uniref:Uncharacterized protein n=1 Tax=Photobacterium aphoticum TaxID=754436 RepID=A0A090QSR3_9GAMM|nr:hypothetical protein JCM19237_1880 [Photobacterium aphoticum]
MRVWRLLSRDDEETLHASTGLQWVLKETKAWDLTKPVTVSGNIDNLHLYHFYNDVYIFAVQVHERFFDGNSSFAREDSGWWHDCFRYLGDKNNLKHKEHVYSIRRAMLAPWLNYTDKMRQLFPSFAPRQQDNDVTVEFALQKAGATPDYTSRINNYQQLKEDKYTLPEDVSNMMKCLFTGNDTPEFKPFIDNRMFVNVSYGLAGNPMINASSTAKYEMLFSLAAYVDPMFKGFDRLEGYAYDRHFVTNLLDKEQYGRWNELGSRFAYTDYSNVYMGFHNEYNHRIGPCHVFSVYQTCCCWACLIAKPYTISANG